MNIATQTQTLLQGLLADKGTPKWLEPLLANTLPKVVLGILVILVASQAADLTWRLIPTPELAVGSPQRIVRPPVQEEQKGSAEKGLDTVAELHLFGEAGAAKPLAQIEQKAPETRLNLTLHGVFVEDDPKQGAAIIGTSGSTQKYYKVGATIMNGVTLQGVFNDRVVLLRNSQSEVLRFPKVPTVGSSSVLSGRPRVSGARRTASTANTSLSGYREVFQKEPLKIFEHVRFIPVRSREGLKGYRVLPQKNRELYNKLGIRPSDLVTAVNGVNLTNNQEAMKLMDMLKDASSVQVDIVRHGQPQSLTFTLN
jgi:general secretion pathway protein C